MCNASNKTLNTVRADENLSQIILFLKKYAVTGYVTATKKAVDGLPAKIRIAKQDERNASRTIVTFKFFRCVFKMYVEAAIAPTKNDSANKQSQLYDGVNNHS